MTTLKIPRQITDTTELEAITITDHVQTPAIISSFLPLFQAGKFRKAQKIVEALFKQEPANPYLLDYLAAILTARKRLFKARKVIQENFTHNANKLFVKVRYADLLCQQKRFSEVKALFTHFDLKKLYPDKHLFPIHDYVSFMSMCAWYYYGQGLEDKALVYAYMVKKVTKSSSSMDFLLRKLNKRSKPGLFARFAKVLTAK